MSLYLILHKLYLLSVFKSCALMYELKQTRRGKCQGNLNALVGVCDQNEKFH